MSASLKRENSEGYANQQVKLAGLLTGYLVHTQLAESVARLFTWLVVEEGDW